MPTFLEDIKPFKKIPESGISQKPFCIPRGHPEGSGISKQVRSVLKQVGGGKVANARSPASLFHPPYPINLLFWVTIIPFFASPCAFSGLNQPLFSPCLPFFVTFYKICMIKIPKSYPSHPASDCKITLKPFAYLNMQTQIDCIFKYAIDLSPKN